MTDKTMSGAELGQKLLDSVRQMKSGKAARTTHVKLGEVVQARHAVGCTQAEFAALLGVSVRTLQEWEQGRREPTGAARTLLQIAIKSPEALRALAA